MIEANLGLTSGVAEMLMQSHERIENGKVKSEYCHAKSPITQFSITQSSIPLIRLLPALPKQWSEGKVTGLLARGGFEVDIEWQDCKLIEATVRSLLGGSCTVRYGAQTEELKLKAGESRKVAF